MATAFLFPGLNALLRKSDRHRFLHLPEVQACFRRAEAIIQERFGYRFDFKEFLELPAEDIYALKNISLAAVAICCIQTGVARRLRELEGDPDWVMGCSLGDLARAVFAGTYTFEDAIYNHIHFTRSIDGIDKIGRNIAVLTPRGAPFTEQDYAWFEENNVDVSCLTPRFLNIGGRYADLDEVERYAREKGWNVMRILDYPVHSRYILPYVQAVESDFASVHTEIPRVPIFSSLSAQPLLDPKQIKQEFLLSITKPIHWSHAVQKLAQDHHIDRFVNIGPCRSLTGLMREIPVAAVTVEASELLLSTMSGVEMAGV
ncbi:acyltransferase domain-containing protein [Bdellovibrio bacteriovorus]|uniref:acyltransferase domain-containing protein n=1 Tax=Bdellovibrio bacteriovorus TaxID=959 RepID=UPI003AA82B68